jgi:carbon monoxide dehydrogenase subunit G
MRTTATTVVSAPIEAVWSVVSDPLRALSFMSGITRWEVESEEPTGLGARYRMLLRIGSAEVGGLIEIVEWDPPRDLAWTSITGVDQRGRWRLRPASGGRTRAEIRLAAGVAGSGIAGWAAERIAQPVVSSHLRTTVRQLARLVEHERMRDEAAQRRAARTARVSGRGAAG